jgi:hypothetical protein
MLCGDFSFYLTVIIIIANEDKDDDERDVFVRT